MARHPTPLLDKAFPVPSVEQDLTPIAPPEGERRVRAPVAAGTPSLDIQANRRARNYSPREQVRRVLWGFGAILFRLSPRPFHAWRRGLLRLFGSRVGREVHIHPAARIEMPWNLRVGDWSALGEGALIYNLGRVTIGRRVTLSQRCHLCAGTHDDADPAMRLLKVPIVIENDAWVCAEAFVGPGVRIGRGAVAGARSVVVRDVEPWTVVAGNPARALRKR
ncbi:hypothetical protein HZA57_04065, partial [Candidatus Poribacteria bacterium]|nr:hypothetical protein [Candidatus Poribacteria bacterium]